MTMTPEERAPGSGRRRAALRRRLQRCLRLPSRADQADAPAFPPRSSSVSSSSKRRPSYAPASPPSLSHSWSDTEVLTPLAVKGNSHARRRRSADAAYSPAALLQSPQSLLRAAGRSPSSSSSSSSSPLSGSRKGVQYDRDGGLLCCRFCDILRARDEQFLYEDAELAVFRPLSPAVESHILVVPRCHIRNVNMLTGRDSPLLERMRHVAKLVLREMPAAQRKETSNSRKKRPHAHTSSSSSSGSTSSLPSPAQRESAGENDDDDVRCKLAFHTPPFNSIDHVHMHAFRTDQQSFFGCVGAIKYRTATWWCRSFDEVMARLDADGGPSTTAHKKTKRPARRHEQHEHLPGHKSRPHGSATDAACALDEEEFKDEQELPALRPQAVI